MVSGWPTADIHDYRRRRHGLALRAGHRSPAQPYASPENERIPYPDERLSGRAFSSLQLISWPGGTTPWFFVAKRRTETGAIPGDKIQRRLGTVLPERSLGGLSFFRNRRVENLCPRFPLIRRRGGRQMANLGSGRKPAAMAWGRKRVVLSRWRHADGGRCKH